VTVGQVLHIQDVDPDTLRQESHLAAARGAIQQELAGTEPEEDSLDPTAIQVGAAVMVAFAIANSAAAQELARPGGTMPELKNAARQRETE